MILRILMKIKNKMSMIERWVVILSILFIIPFGVIDIGLKVSKLVDVHFEKYIILISILVGLVLPFYLFTILNKSKD